MDGTATTGPVTADVDASFGDILDNLELGFMGTYRASRERLSITVDAIHMGLGSNGRGPQRFIKADVDMDQSALEVDVGYEDRATERLCGTALQRLVRRDRHQRTTRQAGGRGR